MLLIIIFSIAVHEAVCFKVEKYELLMPNVTAKYPEAYLCTPIRIDYKKDYYVTGFEPSANSHTAHHMVLYGCKSPGSKTKIWNCGEMTLKKDGVKYANPCSEGAQIIYAWAMDAPKLELPPEVGFRIGGSSAIQYLVLQVHYARVNKDDTSGLYLHYTERPMKKQAGVILLGTGGVIPAMSVEHMETACKMKEKKTIYPFAFRTHTHKLGTVVSGYQVINDEEGKSQWKLLGHRNPQEPQMFYPTLSKDPINQGDVLAARCTMVSNRTSITQVGSTGKDEMCNFYLMYYVEAGDTLKTKYCFSSGPPFYYWRNSNFLNNIPSQAASSLEDSDPHM